MKLTYTSKSKGGLYTLLGMSNGAGELRGERLIVYQCNKTGKIYHREVDDFIDRMIEVVSLSSKGV